VVRAEGEKIHRGDLVADINVDKSRAVEVRCPFDGTVIEKERRCPGLSASSAGRSSS